MRSNRSGPAAWRRTSGIGLMGSNQSMLVEKPGHRRRQGGPAGGGPTTVTAGRTDGGSKSEFVSERASGAELGG
jgi:hypothetical protein